MSDSRIGSMVTLAKKEFMDNIRNKWIIIVSVLFVALIVMISVYQGQAQDDAGFEDTISYSNELVVLFISIVAIMLGYKAITKEVESKSVGLLLTSELDRKDVIIGKFTGLGSVLAFSIVVGLGIGGLIIGLTSGFEGGLDYISFVIFSFLFSLAFLSISFLMSSLVTKTTGALAGGVFIWIFFNIIWDLVLFVLAIATGTELPTQGAGQFKLPDWFYMAGIGNPVEVLSYSTSRVLGTASYLPDVLSIELLTIAFLLWILVPLALAMYFFENNDI